MDAADLAAYVGANASDSEFVEQCWEGAGALVNAFVGETLVPSGILDRAALEVGSELFHRRQAPNGVAQFQSFEGAPVRVARDPMVGAYPLLRPFVGMGVA